MKNISGLSLTIIISLSMVTSFAQETHNLEIMFEKQQWEPDTMIYAYGYSMSSAGDLNQDTYGDFIYLVYYYNVGVKGYIYYGGVSVDTVPDVVLIGESGELGCVSSGDINGDSIHDIIIGQPSGGNGYGVAQVFFGGPAMDSLPDMKMRGETHASEFGISVACGDVNGDACDDLIVGAYTYPGLSIHGRVYVYYGGAVLDTIPDIIISGHNNESMGITVGSGGDLNSDGYEDIVAGAFNNDEAGFWAGKVYVFFGGNPMDTIPDCWLHGEGFNHSLGLFGCDIMRNEYGYDRMITSSSKYDGNTWGRGKVYILYGGDPMDTLPDVWMIGENDSSSLGRRSCSAGDVNGDGYEDALAGAPHDAGFLGTGYVWLGGAAMDSVADAYLRGGFLGQRIGWAVASAGDVNGDGCDEVMFSNYAGIDPTVWVCRYTGNAVAERTECGVEPTANIIVYPNPFTTDIRLEIRKNQLYIAERVHIHLYDVSGREVMSYVVTDHDQRSITIDTKVLPAGIYFVAVRAGAERTIHKVTKIN